MIPRRILTITVFFFWVMSCDKQKDEETACIAPDIKENLIGSWNVVLQSDTTNSSTLEFMKDGLWKEKGDLFFGNYNSPVISWQTSHDSLVLNAKFSNSTSSSYSFVVLKNECNEVKLDLEGFDQVKLTRN